MKNANEIKLESKKIKWEPPALVSLNENNNIYGAPICNPGISATFNCLANGGLATAICTVGSDGVIYE